MKKIKRTTYVAKPPVSTRCPPPPPPSTVSFYGQEIYKQKSHFNFSIFYSGQANIVISDLNYFAK